ncbi:bifunctional 4-hydroxy-2-oxoglutarate aldolase/2-dehydro-3-deoxy-phosphogluconate aldolase [Candidatus Phytoplasma sacchari]|uniref:Bifunctional 4-hydroxy-2-oxoglutarate aldolase/2-dehydro-3-deoxy-phosphogluconate aldolase n=1 Tax=Candidatus Phytoplasma sacchari TaxID=2609813 RepID=A0ABY7M1H2_9MOLU|nr:bifunctional 4-hydroxy-2-oxoglutarate aldolase/2-dehydro-3-deoxy-phosphogluconate aldolase [Candidatus Phytoplasma sacchari]KAB8122729.1 bifunctional 4-hydroxy-2-oxoglutarate aldolase/2-dehydro-3-deoxy-phosphogluconate aldolase [Candidatus Phytoplasma sacchari]WBL31563.1 bifunctional 4-hydroxy-2-oxoglutarate aldolase/2-dehydro-3-deoxy-phosphogluconate aldolase [Candidatus Phytoplasma sacchari]
MTNKIDKHIEKLKKNPISVIVRTKKFEDAKKILKNTIENGFFFAEITLTIPNSFQLIYETKKKYNEIIIGAGTVLKLEEAKKAVEMGAEYLVSPIYNEKILKWSLENNILYIPGVMTVNEMYKVTKQGAKIFKLYPATFLSSETLKLIKQPFPNFNILATGGINLNNIKSYFDAGVLAVGITGILGGISEKINEEEIANLAKKYINISKQIIRERCD